MKSNFVALCSLALFIFAASTGCSHDPGLDRSAAAVSTIKDTQSELVAAHKEVALTLAALDGLQFAQGNLKTPFEKLKSQIKDMDEQGATVAVRAADMRARATAYQQKWQEELTSVTDPSLKAAGEKRAAKLQERYTIIESKAQDVREAYTPFLRQLKELQTYFSNDLTPAALTAAQTTIGNTKASGHALIQKIDAMVEELDGVVASLSTTMPSTAPAK